jgi:hypothetical protein
MFTELMPSNKRGIHIQTQTDGRFSTEMGSGAMIYIYIYIPSFIKIGSGVQKLIGGRAADTHTDTQTA